jgi:hypothetical protein
MPQKQSVGEMLPMSSGRKVLKLARHDVQVRKFMTAPGLGPITALCFKATIRTASSDREVTQVVFNGDGLRLKQLAMGQQHSKLLTV